MEAFSKEFCETQAMFEKIAKGRRFDKPTQEERKRIPADEWYNDGETNKLFKMFLHGYEYGKWSKS
jgi:hypothetical protein